MTSEEEKVIERLVQAVNLAYNSPGRLFWRALLWGLGRGLGATIGLTIILGFLVYLFRLAGLDQTFTSIAESLQKISETLRGAR